MPDNIQNNTVEKPDISLIKQVTTLVSDIKYLKEGQDNFHTEMRSRFDDLQNNYSGRLDRYEARTKSLEDWKIVQSEKVKDIKVYINFIIGLGLIILGLIVYHLTGYHL